jgi:hypothetical protein
MAKKPRIFVNIASYRDTECQWTLRDLFAKAAHPERIFVGICWQFVRGEDDDCFLFETRPKQCRVIEIDANTSRGTCWARSQAQSLWRGEEYTLQIDSHMRFVEHWDEILLAMLAQCDSAKPVISTYPPSYEPPNELSALTVALIQASEYDSNGVLKFKASADSEQDDPPPPRRNPFIAGGLLFGPGSMIADVPYDPYLYFHGEEVTLAVRLFTAGYDVFAPNRCTVFHDYGNKRNRPRHWDDFEWKHLNELSFKRIRHLLGIEPSEDAEVLCEIDRYGLGAQRSLAEFEAFADLDFKNRLINGKTDAERESDMSPDDRKQILRATFSQIWKSNGWGCAETRSGQGASLAQTEIIRRKLVETLDFLDARIVADAGCGECNWINTISDKFQFYFGLDVVEDLVADLHKKYGKRANHFFRTTDIVTEPLPKVDAIICRDVLTHYPAHMVREIFARIKESGSKYLFATTFFDTANSDVRIGGWFPMNLTADPYNLPPPRLVLSEELGGSTKALGLWAIADLP